MFHVVFTGHRSAEMVMYGNSVSNTRGCVEIAFEWFEHLVCPPSLFSEVECRA